jgi:hypothetical protein
MFWVLARARRETRMEEDGEGWGRGHMCLVRHLVTGSLG